MIIISKYLVPKGYAGITLFPFIFVKHKYLKNDKVFVNHEKIHLRQQIELLIVPFYVIYVCEFLVKLIIHQHWNTAYRAISFEREAFNNERSLNYLKNRSFWNFIKYF